MSSEPPVWQVSCPRCNAHVNKACCGAVEEERHYWIAGAMFHAERVELWMERYEPTRPRPQAAKVCDRCGGTRDRAEERYCAACKKIMLRKMRDSGYLTPKPAPRQRREIDARQMPFYEDTESGALRALEDVR